MTIESKLLAEPWRFDLFDVLRRYERNNPGKPRIGDARTLADEYVVVSDGVNVAVSCCVPGPRTVPAGGL